LRCLADGLYGAKVDLAAAARKHLSGQPARSPWLCSARPARTPRTGGTRNSFRVQSVARKTNAHPPWSVKLESGTRRCPGVPRECRKRAKLEMDFLQSASSIAPAGLSARPRFGIANSLRPAIMERRHPVLLTRNRLDRDSCRVLDVEGVQT
jgi:hypothetical protein